VVIGDFVNMIQSVSRDMYFETNVQIIVTSGAIDIVVIVLNTKYKVFRVENNLV